MNILVSVFTVLLLVGIAVLIFFLTKKESFDQRKLEESLKSYSSSFSDWDKIADLFLVVALPERVNHVKKAMKAYGIKDYKIVPATTPSGTIEDYFENGTLVPGTEGHVVGHPNRVACHLSHLNALSKFLKTSAKNVLIFEDDLTIPTEGEMKVINKRLNKYLKDGQKVFGFDDANVIYFGKCWEVYCSDCFQSEQMSTGIRPLCRHAYRVDREGAKIILDNTMPMWNTGDNMIADLIQNGALTSYTLTPNIFNQNRALLKSTLSNNGYPHEFIKWKKHKSISHL
jgi:GR25 family glycosyltransferase involved in LPS biosynthesis